MLARRHGNVAGHIKGPTLNVGRRVARIANPVGPVGPVDPIAPVVVVVEEETVKRAWNVVPSRIIGRASSSTDSSDSSCSSSDASNTCEKPMGSSVATIISVAIL